MKLFLTPSVLEMHDRVDCACFIPVFDFFQICYGVRLDEVGWQNERKSWEKIVKKSIQLS